MFKNGPKALKNFYSFGPLNGSSVNRLKKNKVTFHIKRWVFFSQSLNGAFGQCGINVDNAIMR